MKTLVIDDDFISRQVLIGVIEDFGPCEEAASGAEGLDAFNAAIQAGDPFNLVITDVLMAGMDGHQTVKALREAEDSHGRAASRTPIIMITTIKQFADMSNLGPNAQPLGFISKPVDRAELIETLGKLNLP